MGFSRNTTVLLLSGEAVPFHELERRRRGRGTCINKMDTSDSECNFEACDLLVPRISATSVIMRKVKFRNGEFIASPDQKVLVFNKQAERFDRVAVDKLQPGMMMAGVVVHGCNPEGYEIDSIEILTEERFDSYCVTVPRYGNFALGCGVLVCD